MRCSRQISDKILVKPLGGRPLGATCLLDADGRLVEAEGKNLLDDRLLAGEVREERRLLDVHSHRDLAGCRGAVAEPFEQPRRLDQDFLSGIGGFHEASPALKVASDLTPPIDG